MYAIILLLLPFLVVPTYRYTRVYDIIIMYSVYGESDVIATRVSHVHAAKIRHQTDTMRSPSDVRIRINIIVYYV